MIPGLAAVAAPGIIGASISGFFKSARALAFVNGG
jgi:hypothetical protein